MRCACNPPGDPRCGEDETCEEASTPYGFCGGLLVCVNGSCQEPPLRTLGQTRDLVRYSVYCVDSYCDPDSSTCVAARKEGEYCNPLVPCESELQCDDQGVCSKPELQICE